MADPVSIAVNVIAIATAASQISKAISHLRKLGQVPGRVYALRNEVTDLEVVLRQVGNALQQNTLTPENQHGSLQEVLSRAKDNLAEISKTLERIANACDRSKAKVISRTAVWFKEKSHLQTLQDDIRTVKEIFNLMLGASNS
jgi:DNA repair ATPase RecN